jgi:2'-5' RNA ligase
MYYLFVAVEPPLAVKYQLAMLCKGLPGVAWSNHEQFHLGLRFIGSVDGAQMADAISTLATIKAEPFEITLEGVGFFPPKRVPERIWAGVQKNEALVHLHKKIDTALVRIGLAAEHRKYSPHVTLGRFGQGPVKSDNPKALAGYLAHNSLFRAKPFRCESFALYSSARSNQGPLYCREELFLLSGAGVVTDEEFS